MRDYNRGYYCSASTKSSYLFPPLDLLFMSGIVRDAGHEVCFIDCIAEKIDAQRAIERVEAFRPDCVVALCGIVSWDADRAFLRGLRARDKTLIVVSGDVFLETPREIMEKEEWIDGVLLDFTNSDINSLLDGNTGLIDNMAFRRDNDIIEKRSTTPPPGGVFELPVPMHELCVSRRYRHPFTRCTPLTSVLTTFGCPYHCYFCVADKIPFKYRKAQNVIDELDYIHEIGIREILFFDFTFGVPKEDRKKLCMMMIDKKYNYSWSCYSRVDVLDEEMLDAFKGSGCHTIMFGVESGEDEILKRYNKGLDREKIKETFRLCKGKGIDTVGTFILGGPFDTGESCRETVRFAKELGSDYASFNIAVPRPLTEYRKEAVAGNVIQDSDLNFDHSGNERARGTESLSGDEIRRLRRYAIRSFYLRPGYMIRRVGKVRSWHQLLELISNGIGLLKNYLHFN